MCGLLHILLEIHMLLLFLSEDLNVRFQNTVHIMIRVHHAEKHYSPTAKCMHTALLVMKCTLLSHVPNHPELTSFHYERQVSVTQPVSANGLDTKQTSLSKHTAWGSCIKMHQNETSAQNVNSSLKKIICRILPANAPALDGKICVSGPVKMPVWSTLYFALLVSIKSCHMDLSVGEVQ
jgi:hypothetical protein